MLGADCALGHFNGPFRRLSRFDELTFEPELLCEQIESPGVRRMVDTCSLLHRDGASDKRSRLLVFSHPLQDEPDVLERARDGYFRWLK